MRLKFTLIILFNLIFIFSSGTFVSSSCIYKAVGDTFEIRLGSEELAADGHLTWRHNQRRVFSKKGSNVKSEGLNVDRYGSLILENLQKHQSGLYKGEIFNKDGKLLKHHTQELCVQEPVPEPTVVVECVENGVKLTCIPVNGSEVSWTKNKEKSSTTQDVLHVSSPELKSGDTFSCTLSNKISRKSAKDVQPECVDTGLNETKTIEEKEKDKEENKKNGKTNDGKTERKLLFGFDLWWMVAILTSGASCLLILFIICVVFICRCSARKERKAKEEAEFRLVSLMPDQAREPDVQYMQKSESQRPSKSLRPLPPLPTTRGPPAAEYE